MLSAPNLAGPLPPSTTSAHLFAAIHGKLVVLGFGRLAQMCRMSPQSPCLLLVSLLLPLLLSAQPRICSSECSRTFPMVPALIAQPCTVCHLQKVHGLWLWLMLTCTPNSSSLRGCTIRPLFPCIGHSPWLMSTCGLNAST